MTCNGRFPAYCVLSRHADRGAIPAARAKWHTAPGGQELRFAAMFNVPPGPAARSIGCMAAPANPRSPCRMRASSDVGSRRCQEEFRHGSHHSACMGRRMEMTGPV